MCQRVSVGMLVNRSINAVDSACWLRSCSGLHTLLACCLPRIAGTSWHLGLTGHVLMLCPVVKKPRHHKVHHLSPPLWVSMSPCLRLALGYHACMRACSRESWQHCCLLPSAAAALVDVVGGWLIGWSVRAVGEWVYLLHAAWKPAEDVWQDCLI
jgi:hypothetical protein